MSDQEQVAFTRPVGDGVDELTEAGREYIEPMVTNVDDDVFAFTDEADSHTVATAFMRYSRSKNGARELIAKEFSHGDDKDFEVAFRVSQEFGDDSVQQLYSVDMAVEGLSQLATKQVEWHRPAVGYLEKSTRYVPYDERDAAGKYKYIRPDSLNPEELELYEDVQDRIFENYIKAVRKLTKWAEHTSSTPDDERDGPWRASIRAKALDAARVLLPAATKTNVGFHASAQTINNMILRLKASDITEARNIGDRLLEEAQKVSPVFFWRTSQPHRGGAAVEFNRANRERIQELIQRHLPPKPVEMVEGQIVDLRRYNPEDELELIPNILFDEAPAGYSLEYIREEVAKLSTEEKLSFLRAYMGEPTNRRHKPGRALEQANYTWEFVSDFGAFRDLQRHRMIDDLRWQRLTVAHGFDIPELAVEAGLTHIYREVISFSEKLYSYLSHRGKEVEAQYAVLLGHKMRWTMKTNARANKHIFELRSQPAGHPSYRKTVQSMYSKVEEVHPNLARLSMPFMNQDEDPELGRLDQERAQEAKRKLHR